MKHSGAAPSDALVVTVNSGSTSIKLAAFQCRADGSVTQLSHEHRSGDTLEPQSVLEAFLGTLPGPPTAIAHRVVHGGRRFMTPVVISPDVLQGIRELAELAPLHNPKAVTWIEAAREVGGAEVMQTAAFDTAFFSNLPRVAGEYALPSRFGTDLGVRRYGFHGLAHEALWRRWCELHPELPQGGKLISLQLGGGDSAAAIHEGKPMDITMGFSPLEGLVMGTRSGDLDPAVVPYLQKRLKCSSDHVIEMLNRESGVSGLSGGATDLGQLAADPSPQSQFAVDLYCYRARKYIGAFLTVLGGCDGIVFGGGVGEHVPAVRQRILSGLAWAGIRIDTAANEAARGQEARIDSRLQHGAKDGVVRIYAIPVEEEGILVRSALELLR